MRTKQSVLAFLVMGLAGVGSAYGGGKGAGVVQLHFSDLNGQVNGVSGALGYIRNTDDDTGLLTCGTHAFSDGSRLMTCFAVEPVSDTFVMCSSTNPGLITAADAMNGDSYVFFEFNATGECTHLYVEKSSINAPK